MKIARPTPSALVAFSWLTLGIGEVWQNYTSTKVVALAGAFIALIAAGVTLSAEQSLALRFSLLIAIVLTVLVAVLFTLLSFGGCC